MAGWSESDLQEVGGQGSLGVSAPQANRPTWSSLLARTYSLYQRQFRTFFLISLPPAVLAYVCQFIQRLVIRGIRQQGWLPDSHLPGFWLTAMMVALFEEPIYWVISGFFLAGISTNVLSPSADSQALIADAFSKARERFGAIAAVSLPICVAFVLSRSLVDFALTAILLRISQYYSIVNVSFALISYALMLLFLGGLFSRVGLAIPALMDDPKVSVADALRVSLRRTENWELFFILFLAKSATLGYAAYWLVNLGLANLWDLGRLTPEIYPWVQSLLYICIAAVLESPLFIAFSLLYRDSKTRREDTLAVAAVR